MGPFVGPATSALLAAVLAGVVLGVLRLSRVSLDWWRRRQARIAEPMPVMESPDSAGATTAALAPFRVFPRITSALACASSAALLVLLGALATEHAPGLALVPPALQAPVWDAAALGRAAVTRAGSALVALAATLVAAFVVAAFDRGLEALFARVAPRLGRAFPGRLAAAEGEGLLSFRELRAGASGLWHPDTVHGESFGVGPLQPGCVQQVQEHERLVVHLARHVIGVVQAGIASPEHAAFVSRLAAARSAG